MDWTDLQHFLALAREGSLSAAARSLNVDHVTVARRVAALEAAMSLKLVDRRPRSYELTEDGRRIAKIGAPMAETAFAMERAEADPAAATISWHQDQADRREAHGLPQPA